MCRKVPLTLMYRIWQITHLEDTFGSLWDYDVLVVYVAGASFLPEGASLRSITVANRDTEEATS